MSRIAKKPVAIASGAKVNIAGKQVNVEGPKGKLSLTVHPDIEVKLDETGKNLTFERTSEERLARAMHGTTHRLVQNMIAGVTTGYKRTLEIQGVGYKVESKGKNLQFSLGFANPILVEIPGDLKVTVESPVKIHVEGADKQRVGQFASQVRSLRKPEPYKGKGVRYEGEVVKLKPGKAAGGPGSK
jgi:large subunit ribosomal protein L6